MEPVRGPIKVLIVEDDLEMAMTIEEAAMAGGYEVCGHARNAIEAARLAEHVDVAIGTFILMRKTERRSAKCSQSAGMSRCYSRRRHQKSFRRDFPVQSVWWQSRSLVQRSWPRSITLPPDGAERA